MTSPDAEQLPQNRLAEGEGAACSRCYRICSPEVVYELIENELVVINFGDGKYHGIRGAGVEIWQLLEAGHSLGQIATHLRARYGSVQNDMDQTVTEFVSQLERERLIALDQQGGARKPAMMSFPPGGPFCAPQLDSLDDMQDYLALDPIHDVDEQGWPSVKVK